MTTTTRLVLGSTLLLVTAPQLGMGQGRTKYLMVDGSLLESQSKVRLTMNPPHVSEIPAVSPSEPWESHSVGGPLTVLDFSAAEKRLYYGCNELLADGNTAEYRQCLATSTDGGRSWQKPSMGLVLHNGSASSNILPPFNNSLTGWVDVFRDDKPGVPGAAGVWAAGPGLHAERPPKSNTQPVKSDDEAVDSNLPSVKNAEQPHFRALWNQPWTEECQSRLPLPGGPINISAYTGIEANAYATSANGSVVGGPQFNGDVVATLYPHDGTGLYPVFDCQGPPYSEETCKAVNGGSPQLGNLTAHLAQWHADIVRLFPDPASTAVVALDWEMWWPIWQNNEPDNNVSLIAPLLSVLVLDVI